MFVNAILAIRPTELWSTPTVAASAALALVVLAGIGWALSVVTMSYDREP